MALQDCGTMFDWNDLKHFVAVARHGSTLAAARALEVDPSTVQRRLQELERRLGRPLTQRLPSGSRLTTFGQALLPHAEAVQQAVHALEQQVAALARDLTGSVRVTCPEPIVLRLTRSALLDRFHALHPGLRVEFVMSDRYVDLSNGEADVALRSGDTDDGALVGRKIADSLWAVYASRAYVERHGRPAAVPDLAAHAWVALDDTMAAPRRDLAQARGPRRARRRTGQQRARARLLRQGRHRPGGPAHRAGRRGVGPAARGWG